MSNKVFETGYIASDIELKQTNEGTNVTSFKLAVKRPRTKDKTDFFTVVCWRNNAEFVSKYFSKGSGIEVSGYLQSRTWEDQNGEKRYAIEIVAEDVDFGKKSKGENSNEAETAAPAFSAPQPANFEQLNPDDDLPF